MYNLLLNRAIINWVANVNWLGVRIRVLKGETKVCHIYLRHILYSTSWVVNKVDEKELSFHIRITPETIK